MSVGKIHLSLYEKYYIIAHNVCNGVHVYIRKKGKKSVSMKKLFEKWNSISLILRIVCGLVIGVILGLVVPQATGIAILGDVFVGALKAIAPLLVFFLLISALCHGRKSHGGIIKTVIIMYMFSTFLAALVAVIASRLFPVTLTLADAATDMAAPDGIVEVLKTLLMNMVANPVSSLLNANYIGVLTWGVIIGVGMRAANDTTKKVLDDISNGLSQVVSWIISMAPFGILGLVFSSISSNGLEIFSEYGKLLLVLVGSMLFIYFVTNPIIVFWCIRKNPYPLIFKCLKKSAITAFFTRSSAANIPVNMKACEEWGMDKDTYSVTIPLGATINMDGAAITITVMTLAAANTLGIHVDFLSGIVLSILATLAACGASGVAGGSLLLIPMACSLFGNLQRHCHADRRCRLHHRCHPGFCGDRTEFFLRPVTVRIRRVQTVETGRQRDQILKNSLKIITGSQKAVIRSWVAAFLQLKTLVI